jgi:hypothetical protein
VTRTSARAELTGAVAGVDVGTRGEVWLPESRFEPLAEKPLPPAQDGAEPPTWEHPPEDWDTELPLLAPAEAREPAERDWRFFGRIYTGFDYTDDDQYGSTYDTFRSGLEFDLENPFKRGGLIHFDADYYSRSADVDNGNDSDDSKLLIRRASYRWGGIRGRPNTWEVGRFLHQEFPELSVIDGAEFVHQLDSGSRLGGSVGFLPEYDDDFSSGDDLATSVFHRYVSGPEEAFSFGTAYQKTWHKGSADRDLLINTVDIFANGNTSAHATTWVDFYTSSDDRKDKSVELTQMQFDARYRSDAGNGVGIFASHLRWPDIQRSEFQRLTDEQIEKNKVGRIGANGWLRTSPRTRLHTRVDYWEDQDDSGGAGRLRWSLRDIFYERGEVSFEAYGSQGKFNDVVGGRVNANRRFSYGFLNLYWDSTNFEQDGFNGSQSELLQHRAGFSYDTTTLRDWDLSFWGEKRLGDEQDSWSAGIFLQRRF